jgi:galacturan 1,4-alpha-galacturonidase
MKKIKIAYIGGGSRQWARNLMNDLALDKDLSGEVFLYDIDYKSANDNAVIGNLIQKNDKAKSDFKYYATKNIDEALLNADFVVISILPATFKEMEVYVHHPEKYGIYQSVGDTIGPAGIMRGLISIPIFVDFAKAIKKNCPNAWVINFTNPMTICLQSLYMGFKEIKAYGNCHEVFGSQTDLKNIYNNKYTNQHAKRDDVKISVSGINHFTWITEASIFGENILPLYDEHVRKNSDPNLEREKDYYKKNYPFVSEGKVKYDLYLKYKAMAAAGDRHLAEFMPKAFYLKNLEKIDYFKFSLTPVSYRVEKLEKAIIHTNNLVNNLEKIEIHPSDEEAVRQIKALLGYEEFVTNVNCMNLGHADGLIYGHIVETNALFRYNQVMPIKTNKLPLQVEAMVNKHIYTHKLIIEAYLKKDLSYAILALLNDPLCSDLSYDEVKQVFTEMKELMGSYLDYYSN